MWTGWRGCIPRVTVSERGPACDRGDPGFEPLGEAASGEEALALAAELSPELILLDVRMPVMDGIETARRLSAEHPGAVVVLISINDPAELPQGVECCGAKALIRKQDFGSGLPHQPTARSCGGA